MVGGLQAGGSYERQLIDNPSPAHKSIEARLSHKADFKARTRDTRYD